MMKSLNSPFVTLKPIEYTSLLGLLDTNTMFNAQILTYTHTLFRPVTVCSKVGCESWWEAVFYILRHASY